MTERGTPTLSRVWDVVLKLAVATVIATTSSVVTLYSRVSDLEYAVRRNAEAITRLEAQGAETQRKFDRILEALEGLGTRLTRIETKLELR